jgi:hypothetical protein
VAVQPASGIGHQQRAIGAAAERRIDRADGPRGQRHQRALASLADHREHPMGALYPKVDDLSRASFGDS